MRPYQNDQKYFEITFVKNEMFGPYWIDPYKTRALLWQSILIHAKQIFVL